jgi:hypothetical protein
MLVFQNEFAVLGPTDGQRFLATTGMLSCITVGMWHANLNVAALGHLKQSNPAQTSVDLMVAGFKEQLNRAGGAWRGRDIIAFLCGGRTGINDDKRNEILNALHSHGIRGDNIDLSNCLRPGDAAVNVAIDRTAKSQFMFTEPLKAREWALRTNGACTRSCNRQQGGEFFTYDGGH